MMVATAAAVGVLVSATSAQAAFTFNFDENGNNSFIMGSNPPVSLPSGVMADPVSPSVTTLYYDLTAFGAPVVAGDILLFEGATTNFSDMLRFEPNPLSTNFSYLFVYSDKDNGVDALADVGLPPPNYQSNIGGTGESGPETGPNGLFGWVPLSYDGGYLSLSPITYNFTSDPVPEPSPLLLSGAGFVGLMMIRRLRHLR